MAFAFQGLSPLRPGPGSPASLSVPVAGASDLVARTADFFAEHRPVGPTEEALVRQLAVHAVRQEFAQAAAGAVARDAARRIQTTSGALAEITGGASDEDAQLAFAAAQPAGQTWDRAYLLHSRAFARTLALLHELQEQRQNATPLAAPPGFADEAACEAYLVSRIDRGDVACPRCDHRGGYTLAARRSWECRACHSQHGLRIGTVLAGSQVPLGAWFEAIRCLLWRPSMSTAELAIRIALKREKTVRRLAFRIHDARESEDGSALLAGLDLHFARPLGQPEADARQPESCAGGRARPNT